MRSTGKRHGIAIVALLACLGLTACAGEVKTTADGSSDKTEAAKIGQPVTIKGNTDGSQIKVVAVKVVAAKPADQFSTVEQGMKLVAVQFRINNTGKAPYDDSPSNGAKVVDQDGQQFDADFMFNKLSVGATLPASVKLAPGNKALGFLAFQIPKKSKVAQVQFSMDSGFAETAQWNVP